VPHSDDDGEFSRGTAFHEAGHAVVAWCLGYKVRAVCVEADDDSGHVHIVGPLTWFDDITIRSAGYTAEDFFRWWGPPKNAAHDRGLIVRALERNGIDPGPKAGPRQEAEDRALATLQKHESSVRKLVDVLVKRGQVDGDEFLRLMKDGAA
jgi:hypothetical protein